MAYPGGFREYMKSKKRKLEHQITERAQSSFTQTASPLSSQQIFKDLVFYFDGYLGSITLNDMKDLSVANGASVSDWYESSVTHVIATQLTSSKIQTWKKPVVKPEWILDSITHGKILDWRNYRLFESMHDQRKLTDIISPKQKAKENNDSTLSSENIDPEEHIEIDKNQLDLENKWIKQNICTAPGFLSKYFASSRLHHISTLKQNLQSFVISHPSQNQKQPQTSNTKDRLIMHVDIDCFFASIALKKRPDLKAKPVVITHSSSYTENSTSEIASCNYPARRFGIRNGLSLRRAKSLCPDLHSLPYEFEEYGDASRKLYEILMKWGDTIQVVSCDEAYIDVYSHTQNSPNPLSETVFEIAKQIRKEIYDSIGCAASIGISTNMLLARIATKKAKPDGVYFLPPENAERELEGLNVSDLPGIGYSTSSKLEQKNIITCNDMKQIPIHDLKREFGEKLGKTLHDFSRGIDDRRFENKERRSIGVEINWGVRFENITQVKTFLNEMVDEVTARMREYKVKGKNITIKAKKRKSKMEPQKFLGCGECDNLSKSVLLRQYTDSVDMITKEVLRMFHELKLLPEDIRGLGIHVTQLLNTTGTTTHTTSNNISSFFKTRKNSEKKLILEKVGEVDPEVWDELPLEIRKEYEPFLQQQNPSESEFKTPYKPPKTYNPLEYMPSPSQIDPQVIKELPSEFYQEIIQERKKSSLNTRKEFEEKDLLPSVSQIDTTILNQLPTPLRNELKLELNTSKNERKKNEDAMPKIHDPRIIVIQSISTRPKFQGCTSINDVKEMITTNIIKHQNHNDFFEELEEYIMKLLNESYLDKVEELILHTLNLLPKIPENQHVFIHQTLHKIIQSTQDHTFKKYGGKLKSLNQVQYYLLKTPKSNFIV